MQRWPEQGGLRIYLTAYGGNRLAALLAGARKTANRCCQAQQLSDKKYLPRNEALRVDEVCTEFATRLCEESAAPNSAAKPNRECSVQYYLPRLNAPLAALAPKARIQLGAYLDISQSLNAEVRHTNVRIYMPSLTICCLRYLAMGNCAQRKLGVAGFPLVTRSE